MLSKRSTVALGLLVAGLIVAGAGYLALKSRTLKADDIQFEIKVGKVPVEDLPLCDAKRTTNCAATKVDWDKLEVHVAPGVTRTVVGASFLPNATE